MRAEVRPQKLHAAAKFIMVAVLERSLKSWINYSLNLSFSRCSSLSSLDFMLHQRFRETEELLSSILESHNSYNYYLKSLRTMFVEKFQNISTITKFQQQAFPVECCTVLMLVLRFEEKWQQLQQKHLENFN
ncbi:unnamed protein product [Citrullus colocynthis]|uniref:Uncharacterized protein n=1 Tax=Citrullus colocynthis TaxID=252529 RepID=A0ABP0Z3A0_9ROSI